jgi:hypothetical protein
MIIHTQELGQGLTTIPISAAPKGENYMGQERRDAKLSISSGRVEHFRDVRDLIESLVPAARMIVHKPKIVTTASSKRVKEEERNVRVSAFMYAAHRETDNDFNLIVGRDPKATPEMYMTMVVSGLPPSSNPSFNKLKAARDELTEFFNSYLGGLLPGLTYDFYHPPIPVQIDGSLFFPMSHGVGLFLFDRTAASRRGPGPPSLNSHIPSLWEVHPITKIEFKA